MVVLGVAADLVRGAWLCAHLPRTSSPTWTASPLTSIEVVCGVVGTSSTSPAKPRPRKLSQWAQQLSVCRLAAREKSSRSSSETKLQAHSQTCTFRRGNVTAVPGKACRTANPQKGPCAASNRIMPSAHLNTVFRDCPTFASAWRKVTWLTWKGSYRRVGVRVRGRHPLPGVSEVRLRQGGVCLV